MESRSRPGRERQSGRATPPTSFWQWASLRDLVTSLLAISIVTFTGIVLWAPLTAGAEDQIRHAQAVMALLGPILGAVIGYYFGTASGERVAQQANQRADAAIEDRIQAERLSELTDEELASARQVIERAQRLLVELREAEEPPDSEGDTDAGP